MRRLYRALLALYPYDYRQAFAAEMLHALDSACAQRRGARFHVAEILGLLAGAAREWLAKLTTDRAVRGRTLPDIRMMRPVGVPREQWFARAGAERECSPDTSR